MKRFTCLVLALTLSLTAGAHAPGESHQHATPPGSVRVLSQHDQQGPQQAKHLRIGIWNRAGNISTYTIGNSRNDWMLHLLTDKLFEPAPYMGNAQPWLATAVTQMDDNAQHWQIDLRQGVKWHDGSELTAEDVAFTFEYYRDGPANRWTHHASAVPRLDKVEVSGPYQLQVWAPKPMPNFDLITAAELPILQKAQWQSVKEPRSFTAKLIGTGPYKLVDYKADQYYRFVANADYWRGKPTVDEITLVMIKDMQSLFTALKSGEIDAVNRSLPPEMLTSWQRDPAIRLVEAPDMWGVWLDMNIARAPFDQRQLRQALAQAINPGPIMRQVMLGQGTLARSWPHPDAPWSRADLDTTVDLKAAAQALDKIGFSDQNQDGWRQWPDGKALTWNLKVASNQPLLFRAAQMLQQQLHQSGIKVAVQTLDPASFAALWRNNNYDLRIMEITPHGLADQDMLTILTLGDQKRAKQADPVKAEILERWYNSNSREQRLAISHELQAYQHQYPNRIMLWYPRSLFAYRWQRFDGFAAAAGYGIFHKYSFLPAAQRKDLVTEFDADQHTEQHSHH